MDSTPAPLVSIVLPTYNRADVLGRAVASVLAQTFTNWELIVVDDGSTDATHGWLAGLTDRRIRVVRQANGGVSRARNTGLRLARGAYITFLDSDDEWLPHYLALSAGYLEAHPQQMFVTTEFLSSADGLPDQVFDRVLLATYARRATSLGLRDAVIAQPKDDDYLRVYEASEPLGDWARPTLDALGLAEVRAYRGSIFQAMRWGYLNWLPITMLRREALEATGDFLVDTRSAEDYRFLLLLTRRYPAAMIALPGAIKHENAEAGEKLLCDHLASGAGAHRFHVNKLRFFDEFFYSRAPQDPELQVIRRHHELWVGRSALAAGLRAEARQHLAAALSWRPAFWHVGGLWLLAWLAPTPGVASTALRIGETGLRVGRRLISDPGAWREYGRRLLRKLRRAPSGETVPGDLPPVGKAH
ncbi:MAG TPA: glycosyltransferase family 2 protein [Burkholderiaceae bacterium]|nr:glycosyltransferase family 2 protein [Burkholderiaceae bacterium]